MIAARPRHLATLAVLVALGFCALTAPSSVSADPWRQATPEEELAQRYAPVVELKQQREPCDRDGEPYLPAPVEVIYGDPAVALKENTTESRGTDPVTATGPTAADLSRSTQTSYLDLPGNPRNPRCDYETSFKARMTGLQPTTYAHIVVDQERGKLALQYWFFYYFNDFNNTHESDWEMIQLVFDATTVEEALSKSPELIGYAQHGGGGLAEWDDAKLLREGTHPIVYPAAGSHASYFGSNVYVGWGENGTGFGCDDTTGPSVRVPLQTVLVTDDPAPSGPLAWVLFQGRWGERQPWEFNGPKGPNLGKKWADPMGAISDWRPSSLQAPASDALGPTATDVFCRVSEAGSKVLIYLGVYPWLMLLVGVLAVGVPVVLFLRVRDLLGESLAIYRTRWHTFLGIGLLAIPIGWAFNGFAVLLAENPPLEWLVQWFGDTAGTRLFVAMLVGAVQQFVKVGLVGPAVIQAVTDIRAGREPSVLACYQEAFRNWKTLAVALLISSAAAGILTATLIGIPVAIWLIVRWGFFGQATIVDDVQGGRSALRASQDVVKGHWWTALGASLAFGLIGSLPGPLIGIVLLIFGKTSVGFANGVSSFIYALAIPVASVGLTLFYLRLTGRSAEVRSPASREAAAGGPATAST